jgi:hypothetical protein
MPHTLTHSHTLTPHKLTHHTHSQTHATHTHIINTHTLIPHTHIHTPHTLTHPTHAHAGTRSTHALAHTPHTHTRAQECEIWPFPRDCKKLIIMSLTYRLWTMLMSSDTWTVWTVNVRFVTAATAPKDTNRRQSQAVWVWYRLKHLWWVTRSWDVSRSQQTPQRRKGI